MIWKSRITSAVCRAKAQNQNWDFQVKTDILNLPHYHHSHLILSLFQLFKARGYTLNPLLRFTAWIWTFPQQWRTTESLSVKTKGGGRLSKLRDSNSQRDFYMLGFSFEFRFFLKQYCFFNNFFVVLTWKNALDRLGQFKKESSAEN